MQIASWSQLLLLLLLLLLLNVGISFGFWVFGFGFSVFGLSVACVRLCKPKSHGKNPASQLAKRKRFN